MATEIAHEEFTHAVVKASARKIGGKIGMASINTFRLGLTQQRAVNPVRSGRKQR